MHSVCGIRSITSSRPCRNERRPLIAGVGMAVGERRTRQLRWLFALDFFADVLLLDECDDFFALAVDLLDFALLDFALLDLECDARAELRP